MIQADIAFHRATGVGTDYCIDWDDEYELNGPPPTPLPGCFPGGNHLIPAETPYPVAYKVITSPTQTTYTATQNNTGSSLSCGFTIDCVNACTPPTESGVCDASCDIDLNYAQACPRYGENFTWDITTNASETILFWDDTTVDTLDNANAPTPGVVSVTKSLPYPGYYDVMVKCGTQTCHKRYNAVCQSVGASTPTPSPFSTATPTPTSAPAACAGGRACSHPCSCAQNSQAYINAGCAGGDGFVADANFGGGFGSTSGTAEGNACAPGLVCCTPADEAADSWVKIKGSSYHDEGMLINNIPANAEEFSVSDTGACHPSDPNSFACHVIGDDAGLVTAEGTIDLGTGSVENDLLWAYGDQGYNLLREFNPNTFIQYSLSRRETVTITDPEDVEKDKVNYLNGNNTIQTIDDNGMQGKTPFILLVDNGDLQFDLANKFNSSNSPMVIVVDGTIDFKSTLSEVNGIFIANDFDFAYDISEGNSTTQELLVNGGLISMNDVNCAEKRVRTNAKKPSCFFTFDFVNQYLEVLDLFSTRTFSRTSN